MKQFETISPGISINFTIKLRLIDYHNQIVAIEEMFFFLNFIFLCISSFSIAEIFVNDHLSSSSNISRFSIEGDLISPTSLGEIKFSNLKFFGDANTSLFLIVKHPSIKYYEQYNKKQDNEFYEQDQYFFAVPLFLDCSKGQIFVKKTFG